MGKCHRPRASAFSPGW